MKAPLRRSEVALYPDAVSQSASPDNFGEGCWTVRYRAHWILSAFFRQRKRVRWTQLMMHLSDIAVVRQLRCIELSARWPPLANGSFDEFCFCIISQYQFP